MQKQLSKKQNRCLQDGNNWMPNLREVQDKTFLGSPIGGHEPRDIAEAVAKSPPVGRNQKQETSLMMSNNQSAGQPLTVVEGNSSSTEHHGTWNTGCDNRNTTSVSVLSPQKNECFSDNPEDELGLLGERLIQSLRHAPPGHEWDWKLKSPQMKQVLKLKESYMNLHWDASKEKWNSRPKARWWNWQKLNGRQNWR